MSYTLEVNNFKTECCVTDSDITFDVKIKDSINKVSISIQNVIGTEAYKVPNKTTLSRVELYFIQTDKKPPTWTKGRYVFQGNPDVCSEFASAVTKKVESVKQRPKRLLVVVNPISGGKNGSNVYKKIVEPLFNLAKITTDVIYTERANHMTEIANSYDFSSVDGMVLIGGDGGYQECINTLLKRTQNEAGIDYNDPDVKVKPLDIPIGLIPAGTGNRLANIYYRCLDQVTATLHIIKVSISIQNVIGTEAYKVPNKTTLSRVELYFIQTDKKPPTWTKGRYVFQGNPDVCSEFASAVTKKVESVKQRPKRLLVVVNPISGGKNGSNVYKKIVEPLFNLAKITTDVIYTERANHMTEIANSYDFSSVDGMVLIGGDGGYQECINTLLKRTQNEAGIDYNDPDVKVKPLDIPIGLIPAGTGNRLANIYYRCLDQVTATLHIIKGCRLKRAIAAAYSNGKHISYFGLAFGYGLFSDMMDAVDQKRWLGRARYFYGFLNYFFVKTPRTFELEITCYSNKPYDKPVENPALRPNQEHPSGSKESSLPEVDNLQSNLESTDDSNVKEYFTTVTGTFFNIGMFMPDMTDDDFRMSRDNDIKEGTTTLSLFKPCGRLQNAGHMKDFALVKPDAFKKDFIQNYKVTRCKCKINSDINSESRPEVERLSRLLELDGEIFEIPKLEFEIRLLPDASVLFCGT